jgi:hypothetical protein
MNRKPQLKSPTDFPHPDEWRKYVRQTVPAHEVDYTLAFGRTIMFARFYEIRNQPFPDRFSNELAANSRLHGPERTEALEALNDRIFADMTEFLVAAAQPKDSEGTERATPVAPRETTDELVAYLAKENPFYALWVRYASPTERPNGELAWEKFVAQELGEGTNEEIEFALLVGQLGKLLTYFRDRNLALPPHFSGRVWFLHSLPGAERNAHTRALVQGLAEAMGSCASA